jgi:hypothetical protein
VGILAFLFQQDTPFQVTGWLFLCLTFFRGVGMHLDIYRVRQSLRELLRVQEAAERLGAASVSSPTSKMSS